MYYDSLRIMQKLRSTCDGRLNYKTFYEGRRVFLSYNLLAKQNCKIVVRYFVNRAPDVAISLRLLICFRVGIVELCAKILQIMRNDFKDYARTFCQVCAPFSVLYYT